ncbi:monodehydroascorbate reductase [Aureococcus anophagefferens]|nr:monodehydroascorbate reductase [Aureococcus anophagefferens]
MIATEHGYDLYVCGNGGLNPRHAALLATGIDEATVLKHADRFLMYYVLTANKLERTAPWFESLAPTEDARLARLKAVVIDDALGICDELAPHATPSTFANTDETQAADEMIEFMDARGQRRPSTGADGEAQTNWRPDDADVFARSQKAWLGFGPAGDAAAPAAAPPPNDASADGYNDELQRLVGLIVETTSQPPSPRPASWRPRRSPAVLGLEVLRDVGAFCSVGALRQLAAAAAAAVAAPPPLAR